nr:transposase [Rhizobium deserti]
MPATPGQVKQVGTLRELIWHFYKALKIYRRSPDPRAVHGFETRFDRIFSIRTGYADLDKLLFRLRRRKAKLLRVLERPEIPLHTNASERDLRGFVIKAKDFRGHGQPQRAAGARQHARPDEDLPEARPVVLALSRRSAGDQHIAPSHSSAGHHDRCQVLSASPTFWFWEGHDLAVVGRISPSGRGARTYPISPDRQIASHSEPRVR